MKQLNIILCMTFFTFISAIGYVQKNGTKDDLRTIAVDPKRSSSFDFSQGLNLSPKRSLAGAEFEFAYDIGTRFLATITKEDLQNAQVISDIMPIRNIETIQSYANIELNTFEEDREREIKKKGLNEFLNAEQKRLLQSMDYTSDFYITGNVNRKLGSKDRLFVDSLVLYLTVVPHSPAKYTLGKDALISYLKDNSQQVIRIANRDQLKPGKISFVVSRHGTVRDINLSSTSGYDSIDETMISLIKNLPGSWEVASDAEGQIVDQELVFSFGLIGC